MRSRTALRALLVCGIAMSLAAAPAALAEDRMLTMDPDTVRTVVEDTGGDQPPRCYEGRLAASDSTWGTLWNVDGGKDCLLLDGYSIVHRTPQGWRSTGLGGSAVFCRRLKPALREEGAPRSVYGDLRQDRFCSRTTASYKSYNSPFVVPKKLRRQLWEAARTCGEYQQDCLDPYDPNPAAVALLESRRAILCRGRWGPGRNYIYPTVQLSRDDPASQAPWAVLLVKAYLNEMPRLVADRQLRLNGRFTLKTHHLVKKWQEFRGDSFSEWVSGESDWDVIQEALCHGADAPAREPEDPSRLEPIDGQISEDMKVVQDPSAPPWCMRAYLTRSSDRWGLVTYSKEATRDFWLNHEVCHIADGSIRFLHLPQGSAQWVVAGTWRWGVGCDFTVDAPLAVQRDFGCDKAPNFQD